MHFNKEYSAQTLLKQFTVVLFFNLSLPVLIDCGSKGNKNSTSSYRSLSATVGGDIMLGGLFPVHKKSEDDKPCGEIQEGRGIQRLEAMLFTIDHINNNTEVLPNVRLGASILDTCSRDTYALEQSLEYVRGSMSSFDDTEYICTDGSQAMAQNAPIAVAGVIGGSYSSVSIQVANLLRLFKIPQISYASTSAALSDKGRFDLFARTVPPDNYQAKAMVDIVQYFNWNYVSTVASEGDYGENGIYSFQNEARARNICIAVSEKIPQSATPKDFEDVITSLLIKPNAKVVILFLRVEDAKNLLLAAKNMHQRFMWVASDGWGTQDMPVKDNSAAALGAITIELQSNPVPEFDEYFKSLRPQTNRRNPWFKEYWQHMHECTFQTRNTSKNKPPNSNNETAAESPISSAVDVCSGSERITRKHYTQESKIRFVYHAVYAMAHAIHNMMEDKCGKIKGRSKKASKKVKRCLRKVRLDGDILYKDYLLNVSFLDDAGDVVKFDRQGDGLGRYNILNYRLNRKTGKYGYFTVGEWANGLTMNMSEKLMFMRGAYDTPRSQCSDPCQLNQIKRVQQGDACCWICTTCEHWQYVRDEYTCTDCPDGWWPHENMTGCYELPQQYMKCAT